MDLTTPFHQCRNAPGRSKPMETFTPKYDILPPAQQKLWSLLAPTRDLHFTLYGGTAVALRLGHRQSVDFDFFSHLPLDTGGACLTESMPFLKRATVIQQAPNTISYMTPDNVKLSFFGLISFGRVGEIDVTADGRLNVASLTDLFATKLAVLLQRVEVRDYIDIATIIQAGCPLDVGIAALNTLYGDTIPAAEVLRTITYFEGADFEPLSAELRRTLISAASTCTFDRSPLPRRAATLD